VLAHTGVDAAAIPALVVVVVAALSYRHGVHRLGRRGRRWPRRRSLAFALALVSVAAATQPPVAGYEKSQLWVHALQHVLLGMLAPLLACLGAPLTLALQAGSRQWQQALIRVLHSPAMRVATNPVVAGSLFAASLFGFYFTPLFQLSLRHDAVHTAVHVHFFVAGYLFLAPLVGEDAAPARLPHPARLFAVVLTLPFHAIVGLSILSSRQLLAGGWYERPAGGWEAALADQRTAGGVLWAAGEVLGLLYAGLVVARWMDQDQRRVERLSALATAGSTTGGAHEEGSSVGRTGDGRG
jgi:putative membrane protein